MTSGNKDPSDLFVGMGGVLTDVENSSESYPLVEMAPNTAFSIGFSPYFGPVVTTPTENVSRFTELPSEDLSDQGNGILGISNQTVEAGFMYDASDVPEVTMTANHSNQRCDTGKQRYAI